MQETEREPELLRRLRGMPSDARVLLFSCAPLLLRSLAACSWQLAAGNWQLVTCSSGPRILISCASTVRRVNFKLYVSVYVSVDGGHKYRYVCRTQPAKAARQGPVWKARDGVEMTSK